MTQNFEIIRECLETTHTNVTFLKSVPLVNTWGNTTQITTYWNVGNFETSLSVTFDDNNTVFSTSQECYVFGFEKMSDYIASKLFTKIENKKVENKMEKLAGIELNVLRNGVRVLKNGIEKDFKLAQEILDINNYARDIDAECAYVEREYTHYENTYEVKVQRIEDHKEFVKMLEFQKCYELKKDGVLHEYRNDDIEYSEYKEKMSDLMACECGICKTKIPDINEWKNGVIEYQEYNAFTDSMRTKQMKLGKYLLKNGFPQEIIDYYSAQIKDERTVYLTVTSAPQFITGMSYFAEKRSWDGYNGTSCMDTRHGGAYSVKLGGALADDMLHVAFMHYELEDLNNMVDKMVARVVMRPVDVDGEMVLIPTRYYGNVSTKSMMHYALNQLNEALIYSTDITGEVEDDDDMDDITESVQGGYEMTSTTEVNVYDNNDIDISCTCPACDGDGSITREVEVNNCYRDVTFDCPVCDGSGEYETTVAVEYDEYVDVETEETVYCYYENEGDHYEFDECNESYTMTINVSQVRRDLKEYHA